MQKLMFSSTSPSLTSPCTAGRFPSKDRQAGGPEVQHAIIVQQWRIQGEERYLHTVHAFCPWQYRLICFQQFAGYSISALSVRGALARTQFAQESME
jgi:hypothetical protein